MTNRRILLSKQPHTAGNFRQQSAEKKSKRLHGRICVRKKGESSQIYRLVTLAQNRLQHFLIKLITKGEMD